MLTTRCCRRVCTPLIVCCCGVFPVWATVWILFVFHANTNTHREVRGKQQQQQQQQHGGAVFPVAAKVRPPRRGGAKVGLFATRTPHRPCAIGLRCVWLCVSVWVCVYVYDCVCGWMCLCLSVCLCVSTCVSVCCANVCECVPVCLSGRVLTHRPVVVCVVVCLDGSVARLVRVDSQGVGGNSSCVVLHISGHDLVEGSPILDVKPYLPSYDRVADARAPEWTLWKEEGAEPEVLEFCSRGKRQLLFK